MALPADLMARAVAWPGLDGPGWVNLHWTVPVARGHGVRGRPYKELNEFISDAQSFAANPTRYREIYFCTSTQSDTGDRTRYGQLKAHRHATRALLLKSIWIDIDCGHGKDYPTKVEALAALTAFIADTGIPSPTAIVDSGGGIHAYWISDKPLTVEEWRPYAFGLKAEAVRLKLCKDTGIIGDCARIMRVPGTFNNKIDHNPRPVVVKYLASSDYDFANTPGLQRLTTLVTNLPAPPVSVTVTKPAFELPKAFERGPAKAFAVLPDDRLDAGITRRDLSAPLVIDEVVKGCHHFRECATNHGVGQGQGLWSLTLLACSFFENGEALARNFSKGYPTYDPAETNAKYVEKVRYKVANNLGWPSCPTFEGEGAKCQGCPFRGKIKSPLVLAERREQPKPPTHNFAQAAAETELDLPKGFTLNNEGIICEIIEKTDLKTNATITEHMPLFFCKLRKFRAQGGHRLLMCETSLDYNKWGQVQIDEATDLINETTITKAMRAFGVKPNTNWIHAPKRIIHFMNSFMAKMDAERARQQTIPFGWLHTEDNNKVPIGFAYGGRVCMDNGTEPPAGYSDKQLEDFYKPRGNNEPWWDLLNRAVISQNHPALECIVASSFGAPLMHATGLYNGVICAYSNGSGAGKSTAMGLGAAVWGNPKLTKERPKSSQKGILKKMGLVKALPIFWDEINNTPKMDVVREILGDVTEGAGGTKLTSGRDVAVYDHWQTCMLVGANVSLVENIQNNVKDTDAQLQRVFEYKVEKRDVPSLGSVLDPMTNALDYNYGHMGLQYSKLLGTNIDRVWKLVETTRNTFEKEVGAGNEERFRAALATVIYVGATLANELGCDFHLEQMWEFLKKEFIRQKQVIRNSQIIAGTSENSANALSQFLKASSRNTLWVQGLPGRKTGAPEAVIYLGGVSKQRPDRVDVRFAVSDRTMDVSKAAFERFLELRKHTTGPVFDGLRLHHDAEEVKRVNLAIGSGVSGGRETVLRVPITDSSPWLADMWAYTSVDQRVTAPVTTGITEAAA